MKTRIVALLNQKGGVAKSTVISYLAMLAHAAGFTVAVADTDSSGSFALWMRQRAKLSKKPGPTVLIVCDEFEIDPVTGEKRLVRDAADRLEEAVEKAQAAGVEWLFIDTSAGKHPVHRVAASLADVVLIPTTPSIRDQQVTGESVKLVQEEQKPGFVFIAKGSQSRGTNDRVAIGLSTLFKMPVLSTHIVQRIPIQNADLRGETLFDLDSQESSVLAGQAEFQALWDWLQQHFDDEAGAQEPGRVAAGV